MNSYNRFELLLKMAYPESRAESKAEAATEYKRLLKLHNNFENDIYISISRNYIKEKLHEQVLKISYKIGDIIDHVFKNYPEPAENIMRLKLENLLKDVQISPDKEKIDNILNECTNAFSKLGLKQLTAFLLTFLYNTPLAEIAF
ncbi:MAG TPA: hypothetical protein VF691_13615 [Cytophagaceae bacterium]|jgi:hypothetical protein